MSEDVKDKDKAASDAAKAGAPAAVAAPAAGSPVVLIAVLVLALCAGSALGAMLIAPRVIRARQAAAAAELADPHHKKESKNSRDKNDKKGDPGKSPVYKLDNIIVNPADSDGQRFLMCTVAIESEDAKALDVLREHEIELRDKIVSMLGRQQMERLTSQNSRDSLRADLLGVIRPVLGAEGKDVVLKIYLPNFVVQ